MRFWNLELSLLRTPEVMEATPAQLGTWVLLAAYCLDQVNSGTIGGCAAWGPRHWQRLGIDHNILAEKSALWTFDDGDLRLWGYPVAHEVSQARKDAARANGAKSSGRPKKTTPPKNNPTETQSPIEKPKETQGLTQETPQYKVREDKVREDKSSQGDGTDGFFISTLADALSVARSHGISSECATKWFLRHSTRQWTDDDGQPIVDRLSALVGFARGWERRARAEAALEASTKVVATPIDPEPEGWRSAASAAGYDIDPDTPWAALAPEARRMALNLAKKIPAA